MALATCAAQTDSSGRELAVHGTTAFPVACYQDDLRSAPVPWHWHQELEAAVILSGACTVSAGRERRVLTAGQGFFINTSVLHGIRVAGDGVCRFHSLVFHPRLVGGSLDSVFYGDYLQPILERQDLECLFLSPEEPWQRDALQAMEQAWQACVQEPAGFAFTVRQSLSALIFALHSHLAPAPGNPGRRTLREAERIKAMLTCIHEGYAGPLSVETIAASALISPSECLRCFRSVIGTTPMQYVKNYRLHQAARLLRESKEPICDIADACGFQDFSYFARTFRTELGCTPSEYRQNAAEKPGKAGL